MVFRLFSILLLLSAAGCASKGPRIEPLRISLVSLMPVELGMLEQRYLARLRVQNPRPNDVPLDGINMDLELNGKTVARGVGKLATTVPAFGEQVIEVPAVSTLSDVLGRITDLPSGIANKNFRYRIAGKLYKGTSGAYEDFSHLGKIEIGSRSQ
ncbi:MAG: LEA type 2 family protein [Burkholderiales bacterium]